MGLFDFFKKKGTARISPTKHYSNCVEAFHKYAKSKGYATKGVIYIPELIPLGQQAILKRLQSDRYTQLMLTDIEFHWFSINTEALQMGIVFATAWHEDFQDLQKRLKYEVMEHGPAPFVAPIFEGYFPFPVEDLKQYCFGLFEVWEEQLASLGTLADVDPRPYSFNTIAASYQLGISMALEKLGY